MSAVVRSDLVRLRGNLTATYEHEWADGCVVRFRTRTSYAEARVVDRNEPARTCPEHRSGGR